MNEKLFLTKVEKTSRRVTCHFEARSASGTKHSTIGAPDKALAIRAYGKGKPVTDLTLEPARTPAPLPAATQSAAPFDLLNVEIRFPEYSFLS